MFGVFFKNLFPLFQSGHLRLYLNFILPHPNTDRKSSDLFWILNATFI